MVRSTHRGADAAADNLAHREVIAEVQRAVLPYDHNYVGHASKLAPSLDALHETWSAVRDGLTGDGEDLFRARGRRDDGARGTP